MNLAEQVQRIETRQDLAAFIEALRGDFGDDPGGWENPTLDSFLEALAAWSTDMDGYFENRGKQPPEQPSWRLLGEMLLAASMYE